MPIRDLFTEIVWIAFNQRRWIVSQVVQLMLSLMIFGRWWDIVLWVWINLVFWFWKCISRLLIVWILIAITEKWFETMLFKCWNKRKNVKFTHPKLPSIVRLIFFVVVVVVRFSFWILILILSPNLLNCLSSCLINSKSSAGKFLNVSSKFFGPFVGFSCVVAFLSKWFCWLLQSATFVQTNAMAITCGWPKQNWELISVFTMHAKRKENEKLKLSLYFYLFQSTNNSDMTMIVRGDYNVQLNQNTNKVLYIALTEIYYSKQVSK